MGMQVGSSSREFDDHPEVPESIGQVSAGLLHLSEIYEKIAKLDSAGELHRLSKEVLEERREMERQLARRRDFERQLHESRVHLDRLKDERLKIETESAAKERRIEHLQDSLLFMFSEVDSAEGDLKMLRESHDLAERNAPFVSSEHQQHNLLSKLQAEMTNLKRDEDGIYAARERLNSICQKKSEATTLQHALLEKKRQTDQDRGLLLSAISAESEKLALLRNQRMRAFEQKLALEHEITALERERGIRARPVALEEDPYADAADRYRAQLPSGSSPGSYASRLRSGGSRGFLEQNAFPSAAPSV